MAEQITINVTENKTINVSDVLGNLKIADAAVERKRPVISAG